MEQILDMKNEIEYSKLKVPAEIIKQGGIVIFPTETVYGIGTNGLNKDSIENLYEIKQRPRNKPISLLVSNFDMINEVAESITELEYKIMKEFFPGPLTMVLKKKSCVPDELTAGGDTVGIRMPENKITLKLIEYAGVPIATPSANISGKPSGTNIESIKKDFKGKVEFFIDGGESRIGKASTIVKVENNEIKILRQGIITKEEIIEKCK